MEFGMFFYWEFVGDVLLFWVLTLGLSALCDFATELEALFSTSLHLRHQTVTHFFYSKNFCFIFL
jgi:hypothetical protein